MPLLENFWQLIVALSLIVRDLIVLGARNWLVIAWFAWWLFGVNWSKVWPTLRKGAWAPLVLLILIAALVWSRLSPSDIWFGDLWMVPRAGTPPRPPAGLPAGGPPGGAPARPAAGVGDCSESTNGTFE